VANPDRQRGGCAPVQASLSEQAGQVAFADTGQAGLVVGGRIQLAHRGAERGQRPAAARVIPYAGRYHSAGPGDPAHLPQALNRVSHEVNDQLR
jgi:hypothetical protein